VTSVPRSADVSRVLILKADRLCGETLRRAVLTVIPAARVSLLSRVEEARAALASASFDLLLTGVAMIDGDVLDLLSGSLREPRRIRRVLVVTGRKEVRTLESVRAMPVDGVFDSSSGELEEFERALRSVISGRPYWSASVLACLSRQSAPSRSICRLLTPVEQLVLAVIGDGSDDRAAAQRLGLRSSSIHSVRRELHRKLGAKHKGELVRLAVQHGFVRFTPEGVVRPGFALLTAACSPRREGRERDIPERRTRCSA